MGEGQRHGISCVERERRAVERAAYLNDDIRCEGITVALSVLGSEDLREKKEVSLGEVESMRVESEPE